MTTRSFRISSGSTMTCQDCPACRTSITNRPSMMSGRCPAACSSMRRRSTSLNPRSSIRFRRWALISSSHVHQGGQCRVARIPPFVFHVRFSAATFALSRGRARAASLPSPHRPSAATRCSAAGLVVTPESLRRITRCLSRSGEQVSGKCRAPDETALSSHDHPRAETVGESLAAGLPQIPTSQEAQQLRAA